MAVPPLPVWAFTDETGDVGHAPGSSRYMIVAVVLTRNPGPRFVILSPSTTPLVLWPRDPQSTLSLGQSTRGLGLSPGSLSPRIKETKGKGLRINSAKDPIFGERDPSLRSG